MKFKKFKLVFYFVLLFTIFWIIGWNRLDVDFGWHLQTGIYIRAHGIPTHDIYSYTASSYHWVDHEWGNDVILSLFYSLGGYAATGIVYSALWAGALLIAAPKARLVTLLVGALAITPYVGYRPLAWTTFLFAILLSILKSPRQRLRLTLPLLFLFWANIHAGFIAGLAVMAYFVVLERNRKLAYLLCLSTLVTIINPYGINLYGEISHTIFDPAIHSQITEWHSFYIEKASYVFVLPWFAGFWFYRKKLWQYWLGLSPLLFVATLSATRNMPLFVITALRGLDDYISLLEKNVHGILVRPWKIVMGLLVITLVCTMGYSSIAMGASSIDVYSNPVAYLQQHHCSGNLFNSYNYGGYLIWKLPSQKVFIDGRMPTWRTYMQQYEDVIHDPSGHYKKVFQQYNIKCAFLSKGEADKLIGQLQKDRWTIATQTPGSIVLLSPDSN